jgi:hypothetical protein
MLSFSANPEYRLCTSGTPVHSVAADIQQKTALVCKENSFRVHVYTPNNTQK